MGWFIRRAGCVLACLALGGSLPSLVTAQGDGSDENRTKGVEIRSRQTDPATSTALGRVRALLVGVNEYQNPNIRKLRFAAKDAREIADRVLPKMPGAQRQQIRTLLLDGEATRERILAGLDSLVHADRGDTVLIYFSVHGKTVGKAGYLVAYDTDPWKVEDTGIPVNLMLERVRQIQAERVFVILDACYSGSATDERWAGAARTFMFGPTTRSDMVSSDALYDTVKGRKGHFVLAASEADQEALELTKLGHGLFTYFVLQGLEGAAARPGNAYVTVFDLHDYVANYVQQFAKELKKTQTPMLRGDAAGLSPIMTTDPSRSARPSEKTLAALLRETRQSYESSRLLITGNGADTIELWIGDRLLKSWTDRNREELIPPEVFDRYGDEIQIRLVAVPRASDRRRAERAIALRRGDEKDLVIESSVIPKAAGELSPRQRRNIPPPP